ncbi:MAG: hypothetical protein A2528_02970 [Candidatus Staskawiczbacteria bacterium RIFOXYD2_FULL_37_9]|uniref:Uncharacterized protein n=1 Tax=Candidatus Staskawiczbacteria bacterium RIFOXYB1_FULL_37_44 TaxID=1802223 RepID=A0A1G2IX32_9BACT|nr:MAG: hypothetical protein A2358_00420 [Candidatus Staskawiczbacteria bacterium RIFOXYB1_FULL_37_44]OGZ83478.1 MAG: hypothetical protein A2416_04085 [Candidatus Staskawiczbacteria bacterium RIFOXYC1_FULL_37_52]OGZ89643.1 MAG: hypothetical protein A2444_04245 [Candidatus Staskawiczbacteria bacterium RIFOXYC2_FULL_37_19]OGZ90183.1 MAG: hypothetical protein A2581_02115 [Candidatus Staskawiczbacteria bacterium RIFOXYD1_FULL_37_110]OGZ94716.1 MAG: hypothetical protein A2528_02970 [Candidatus Stask
MQKIGKDITATNKFTLKIFEIKKQKNKTDTKKNTNKIINTIKSRALISRAKFGPVLYEALKPHNSESIKNKIDNTNKIIVPKINWFLL